MTTTENSLLAQIYCGLGIYLFEMPTIENILSHSYDHATGIYLLEMTTIENLSCAIASDK